MDHPSSTPESKRHTPRSVKIIAYLVFPVIILFFLMLASQSQWLMEMLFALVAGWFIFISNNLTDIHFNWEMISCGLVALGLGTYGFHRTIVWIRKGNPWLWKWTISIISLMLFLFAASIAMTGIIHQSAWLFKSPLLQSNRNGHIKAVAHLSQIKIGLVEYQYQHGAYPEHLEQLKKLNSSFPNTLLYDQTKQGWQPWIYFGAWHNAHQSAQDLLTLPLVMTPAPHGEKYVVLTADGGLLSLTREQLYQSFPKLIELMPHLVE